VTIAHKTILLVDDDPNFLDLAQETIQNDGYRVITRTSGHDALSVIDGGAEIDLIIVDYRMPEMDGLNFLTAMNSRKSSVPIIMLTAHVGVEVYLKALQLGAYEFINKPVNFKELQTIIRSALNKPAMEGNMAFNNEKKDGRLRIQHL
jgi:DNA-binding NtrC family response regulator